MRFGQKNDKTVKYTDEDKKEAFLSKIATASDKRRKQMETQSVASEDADQMFEQNKDIEAEKDFERPRTTVGRSLLSPQNKTYQNAEKVYISPFSDEYGEKEENFEEEMISHNRMVFFGGILLFLYFIILGVGYHYTIFVEDIPQITTMQDREKSEYMEKIDEYILTLQNIQAETEEMISKNEEEIVADSELHNQLQNDMKKITDMTTEMKDIKPPDEYTKFHSQLNELYMLYSTYCNTYDIYLKNKNQKTEEAVIKTFEKYQNTSQDFWDYYNSMFQKENF